MKNIFYCLTLIFILSSCKGSSKQPDVYGERPLNLKELTFDMDMQGFFPAERIIDQAPLQYIVEIEKDALNNQDIPADRVLNVHIVREVVWNDTHKEDTLYHYYTSDAIKNLPQQYKLAIFGDYYFDKLNITTTSDDELIMVAASCRESDSETAKELYYELARTYGEPERERVTYQGLQECDIFTWEKKDRIIKYHWTLSSIFEKNDLRDLHLYVIKKDHLEAVYPQLLQLSMFKK